MNLLRTLSPSRWARKVLASAGVFLSAFVTLAAEPASDSAATVHRDVVFARPDGVTLRLDVYLPESPSTEARPPLVVWIHGGGWRGGSKNNVFVTDLLDHHFAIASIQYRLTDKAIFPAQIHDCKAAIRWLRAHADDYGYDATRICVAGSSAGGHLALLVGTSGGVEELEGDVAGNLDQSSSVQAVVDFYGPSDFVLRGRTHPDRAYTEKSGSFALLGGLRDGKIDTKLETMASPARYVSQDDPPLLALHGTQDKTVLMDQSEHIVRLYKTVGVPVELIKIRGAGHGGAGFRDPEVKDRIRDFVKTHLRPAKK